MTAMTYQSPILPRWRPVDPVAFTVALIGAPLAVTVATCWLIVPLFALVFGGPLYLIFGAPILFVYFGLCRPRWFGPVILAALTMACLWLGAEVLTAGNLIGNRWTTGFGSLYGPFGMVFGPLWALPVTWLYRQCARQSGVYPTET